MTATESFGGTAYLWDKFVQQPETWPKSFVLVNVTANSTQTEVQARLREIESHGYRLTRDRTIELVHPCQLGPELMRFERA